MKHIWSFRAIDTLFFRDATPFHPEDPGAVHPRGVFPPMVNTIQGAIRTFLAFRRGWKPGMKFPEELGDWNHLGNLQLTGPWIRFKEERLFPAPSHLIGKAPRQEKDSWKLTRLQPGNPFCCDMGSRNLPEPVNAVEGAKPLEHVWITRKGLEQVLAGKTPSSDELVTRKSLWEEEHRIGIEVLKGTRTVKDRHLFTSTHVRPDPEVRVEIGVEGIPADWHPHGEHSLPLGGEGRFAALEVKPGDIMQDLPARPELVEQDGYIHFTVTLVTPGKFDSFDDESDIHPVGTRQALLHGPLMENGWVLESAAIGTLIQVGGWDQANGRPRPLVPLVPAGSTWFYKAPAGKKAEIEALHGSWIGKDNAYGYGQIVIGVW